MFHRWAAPLLVLALWVLSPETAAGQQSQPPRGQGAGGSLGRSYPNPFNPEVFQPFGVADDVCTDGSQQHVVVLKAYNVLMQPIATFVVRGASATSVTNVPAALHGQRIDNLRLGCGQYEGYWNGRMDGSGKEAPSGTYLVQLFIDGKLRATRRVFIAK